MILPYAISYTKDGIEGNYTHSIDAQSIESASALFKEKFPNTSINKVWINQVQLGIRERMNTIDTMGD